MNPETQAVIDAALARLKNPYEFTGMPEWFDEFRPHQIDAINQIIEAYSHGVRVVVLDAPTGSGKTLIGESVRRLLGGKALYVCNNKALQDQFGGDYPYAQVLKGRSNYDTWTPGITADFCNYTPHRQCSWCPDKPECPYEVAKKRALVSPLSVLNTSYLLAETNGPGKFRGRGTTILDEADTLENTVMGFVSLDVSRSRVEQLKLGVPEFVTKEEAWLEWIGEAVTIVSTELDTISRDSDDPDIVKEQLYLANLWDKLTYLRKGIISGRWVYTGKNGAVSFKPVEVNEIGRTTLWPAQPRYLLMSATIISADQLLADLGWDEPFELVSMGSTFPVDNRQVKFIGSANMSKRAVEESVGGELEKMGDAVVRVLNRHEGDRVLIHTVSYDLSKFLQAYLKTRTTRKLFTYDSSFKRESVLRSFKRTKAGVLIAPSMDRGVDLPDDLCRVVIVAKIPFPNLGDRQINARLRSTRGGQTWYNVQTIRSLVQMTGRATRHKDDFSVSYILDSQFRTVWSKNPRLFPSWWVDALDWRDNL